MLIGAQRELTETTEKAVTREMRYKQKCVGFAVAAILLTACGTNSSSDDASADQNSYEQTAASKNDEKVPEPISCPDYEDNYSTPYKYCDSGSDVFSIQEALVDVGFSIDVDGYYGPGTRAAVKEYQSKHSLTVTGQVNDSTWSKLVGSNSTQSEYSDEAQQIYETPSQTVIPYQRQVVDVVCDIRESGLSSSWYGQSYFWTYYNVWSDGSRTVAQMGQGYNPPLDCL